MNFSLNDKEIKEIIAKEARRQQAGVELIASENFVSEEVLQIQGSILTNKYAEGYPGNRYYGGCEFVDEVERLAIKYVCELFDVRFANVQPHSGSQANMAAMQALLKPGDKILGMSLNEGGHLTHGFNLSFSGIVYDSYFYGVDEKTEMINYDRVLEIAKEVKPKLIIVGASSYSRAIDYSRFRKIADEVGAYLMADIAHVAGLIAAKLHPSPVGYADVITSTTHKTLRGPRGGLILTNDENIAKKINKAVFPGIQGGPLMHVIGAKARAFKEALSPYFVKYQEQVIENAKTMANHFKTLGYRVISGGTDNHLLLLDVKQKFNITGKQAETILGKVNITINKNSLPFDQEKPMHTSGIRIGTPAVTTRGLVQKDMIEIANWIDKALQNRENNDVLNEIKQQVELKMEKYPLHKGGILWLQKRELFQMEKPF